MGSEEISASASTRMETIQYKHILNPFYLCTKHISIQLNEYVKDNHKKINCIIN